MNITMYQKQPFLAYKSIVMVYQKHGIQHLAHVFVYEGREARYLLFLYKDQLPKGDFIKAWNELDDTSYQTMMVPEPTLEQAIDDFLAVWNFTLIGQPMEIFEVQGFDEIETIMKVPSIQEKEVIFFGRK